MKARLALGFSLLCLAASVAQAQTPIPNRLIDFQDFLANARQVEAIRESRRLSEHDFLMAMTEPGVVVLDARSESKFRLRHLRGAVNLSLPDITAEELARIIPTKDTKVLIYCNNNFTGSPVSLPSKAIGASLNLPTFVTLTAYGYTNVYELGPLLDVKTTWLPFAGTEVGK